MSQLPLARLVAVARISWHRRHTRSHNNNDGNRADGESDAGDGLGNTAADNSVRWRLFKEWTHNEWSCLGCYLLCALNRPIRDILMFIFLYSDGHNMNEEKFRQKYMFDREELERRKRCIAKGDTGFIEWCSGRPTGAGARPFSNHPVVLGPRVDYGELPDAAEAEAFVAGAVSHSHGCVRNETNAK